jgi:hypothetical protein
MALERWMVPLEGHAFDVEDLPLWLAGGEVTAVVDDGAMCLALPATGPDHEGVLERAAQFLDLLNGAMSVLEPTFRPLVCSTTYYGVNREGQKVSTVISVGTGEVRCKAGALGVAVDGVPAPDPRHGAALPLLAVAKASPEASDALTLVGRQRPTWSELAVVLELAKDASGGKLVEWQWISRPEEERFRRTANSRKVLGKEARHGHANHEPPPNPMTYTEAVRTIRQLVANWLRRSSPREN